jgi:hypothetical protein
VQETGPQIDRQEPTLAEFETARKRVLARLNVRLFSITGKEFHTSDDLALLEGDIVEQETLDRETVRLWSSSSKRK